MNDVVVDTNIARLFDAPADPKLKPLFLWLRDRGHLTISRNLINEYSRQGNRLLAVLLNDLGEKKRLNRISNYDLKSFSDDKHFSYTCNVEDIYNARTVFLSFRKILVSFDSRLRTDVNSFRKIDGIKPRAFDYAPFDVLS